MILRSNFFLLFKSRLVLNSTISNIPFFLFCEADNCARDLFLLWNNKLLFWTEIDKEFCLIFCKICHFWGHRSFILLRLDPHLERTRLASVKFSAFILRSFFLLFHAFNNRFHWIWLVQFFGLRSRIWLSFLLELFLLSFLFLRKVLSQRKGVFFVRVEYFDKFCIGQTFLVACWNPLRLCSFSHRSFFQDWSFWLHQMVNLLVKILQGRFTWQLSLLSGYSSIQLRSNHKGRFVWSRV